MKRRNFFQCFGLGALGAFLPSSIVRGSIDDDSEKFYNTTLVDWDRTFSHINVVKKDSIVEFIYKTEGIKIVYIYYVEDISKLFLSNSRLNVSFIIKEMYHNKKFHNSVRNNFVGSKKSPPIYVSDIKLTLKDITFSTENLITTGEPSVG